MLNCFTAKKDGAVPITVIAKKDFPEWLKTQPKLTKDWLASSKFRPELEVLRVIPDEKGKISRVLCCVTNLQNLWEAGGIALLLPEGLYAYDNDEFMTSYATAWGLSAYQFTRYKKPVRDPAKLYLPGKRADHIQSMVESIYLVRDWINTPTDDMGPTELAKAAAKVADTYNATLTQIVGEDLLHENFASIFTVGRASDDPPRLLDLRWGNPKHPKVTLVGKGVCFDSGGLDLKPAAYMLLMKKDMAGGAHVFGLARMIMEAKLPVCLRVLVPAVENVISGNAYRPGDVIKSRKGLTIEIGNTDAEGRVVLADALTEAVSERPDLLIDISTLTGAARVALGTELPAVFSNNEELVAAVIKEGETQLDPMWRLPLFPLYREYLNSSVADINNNSVEPYAGAITAALFLKEFVPDDIPWLHFDMMAWNLRSRPGRPQGGEAMAIRALFSYLSKRFKPV